MAEPPVCPACDARHWFLDPCGTREVRDADGGGDGQARPAGAAAGPGEREVPPAARFPATSLAATASADEIERALKAYRQRREQSKRRMRRIRAGDTTGSGS